VAPVAWTRWRAARLLEAPHRLCFFTAGAIWAATAAWWAACLLSTALGMPWHWAVPSALAHGLCFSLGPMPLFIVGFLFTAGPRWLHMPPVSARSLRSPVAALACGWGIALAGYHLHAALAGAGVAVVAAALAVLSLRFARLVSGSTAPDRRHPVGIALACLVMVLCLFAAAVALFFGEMDWLRAALRAGLWGGVVSVFVIVSHRMLPFVGESGSRWLDARWPSWPFWLLLSVPLAQAWIAGAGLRTASAAWVHWLVALHMGCAGALSILLAARWIGSPARRQPVVAMLHVAFCWWGLALLMECVSWLPVLRAPISAALGLAGTHALTMGYLGGTLLTMSTRVSSAHNGRSQVIDSVARVLHWMLQTAIVLRLLAELWPVAAAAALAAAALAWLIVAATWAVRHGLWQGLSRADGRTG
jgi:uncharacterized protein involved in response to NO